MLMRTSILISLLFLSSVVYCQSTTFLPVVEWEKLLGGNGGDYGLDLLAEADGSIVAVGKSYSTNGDVSGHHGDSTQADGWVVKLDNAGNILWQKSIGGTSNDEFTTILATADGGYLCVGNSYSADMDVPANNGLADAWLVKLSQTGDIEWSRNYGNNLINTFVSASVMDDGNIAAIMESKPNTWTTAQTSVIKFDPQGNILWQTVANTGTSIVETDDHRLLTSAGILFDGASGTASTVIWNMVYGASALKKINGIIYAVTYSYPNGNDNMVGYLERTEGNAFNFVGQVWATDFSAGDESGYQTTYSASPNALAYLSSSDSYVVGGTVITSSRGGVYEYGVLSTEGNAAFLPTLYRDWERLFAVCALGNGDEFVCAGRRFDSVREKFWVVKYSIRNIIRGNAFLDLNNNNIQDAGEQAFNNLPVKSTKNGLDAINKTLQGAYTNFVGEGTFTTSPVLDGLPYYTASPASDTTNFIGYKNKDSINFAIHKTADARDYNVSLASYSRPRPGFTVTYELTYGNKGTDTLSDKVVRFVKDSRLDLAQTSPLFDAISGDTISWNVNNIAPGAEGHISINMIVGGTNPVVIGNTLNSYVFIDEDGDVNTIDNKDSMMQVVMGSFDPNDKSEIHGDFISKLEVENSKFLKYTIRFQNTGNDTAFNIVVRDTLQSMLDASTFEMVSASHPYTLRVKDGKQIAWHFDNVLLVDSLHNEPASHGYITYRIKAKNELAIGDIINNSASIYFDFNAPVKTNTQKTLVVKSTAIWTGAISNTWEDANNWNIGVVPDAETVVIIPASVLHYPAISSAAACFALRVDKNATIMINEGYNLEITGK